MSQPNSDEDFQAGARTGDTVVAMWIWEFGIYGALRKASNTLFVCQNRFQDGQCFAISQFRARHNPMNDKLTLDRP